MKTRIVNNFVHDVYYTRSIDGLLIKLGSLISDINKSIYPFDDTTTKQLLRRILLTEKVLKALSPFSDHVHDIRSMIENDPRHCSLRDYVDEIVDAMNEAKKHRDFAVKRTIDLIRPPLREIEKSEKQIAHKKVEAPAFARRLYEVGRRRALKPIVAGIVVLVAFLVLASLFFDYDSDGLMNYEELIHGTNFFGSDTDGDGLSDKDEIYVYRINPLAPLTTKHVFEKTMIEVQGEYLVVKHLGRWLPYLWIETGKGEFHLTYFINKNSLVAEYVLVNSTLSLAKYRLHPILSASNASGYVGSLIVNAPDVAVRCKIVYLRDRRVVGFEKYEKISLLTTSSSKESLHESALMYVNKTSIQFLQEYLLSKRASWNPVDLAWYVLAWLDSNAVYDYSKALVSELARIYDPITFYNKKSGICSDYALFTVTALLAGGLNQAYIFVISTDEGMHSMAGIEIDGRLFVLDQRLPPYEWTDYVEHVSQPIGESMQVIKMWLDLSGQPAMEVRTVNPTTFTTLKADSYPSDRVPQSLVEEALMKVCNETNTVLKPHLDWRLQVTWQILDYPPLKAYNPVFHNHFVDFFAKMMRENVGQYFNQARYVWYKVEGNTLILYFK